MTHVAYTNIGAAPFPVPPARIPWDVGYLASYGQSDSVGTEAEVGGGDVPISTGAVPGLKMLGPKMNQGVIFNDFTRFQAPIAAVESAETYALTNFNETPVRGMMEAINGFLTDAGNPLATSGQEIWGNSMGNPSASITTLDRDPTKSFGDTTYAWGLLEAAVAAAKTHATAASKTFGVLGISWHQGAADYPSGLNLTKTQYRDYLLGMADDLQTYIGGHTGQSQLVYLVACASNAHAQRGSANNAYIAEAAALAAEQHDAIVLGNPQYAGIFGGFKSGVHHRPYESKRLGAMAGRALFDLHCARSGWWDFLPSAVSRSASDVVKIDFDVPEGFELKFAYQSDARDNMRPDKNLGFRVLQTGTTTEVALATSILPWISGDSVYLKTAAALPATCDLNYGSWTYGGGLTIQPVDPADRFFITDGFTDPVHRHCSPFREVVPA